MQVLYQGVSFPRIIRTHKSSASTVAHHVIDGEFARNCHESVQIRMTIGRVQPSPVLALNALSAVHFSHPLLIQQHLCEPDAQHRLMSTALRQARRVEVLVQTQLDAGVDVDSLRGIDDPDHWQRSLSPQIILFVSEAEPARDAYNKLDPRSISQRARPGANGPFVSNIYIYAPVEAISMFSLHFQGPKVIDYQYNSFIQV